MYWILALIPIDILDGNRKEGEGRAGFGGGGGMSMVLKNLMILFNKDVDNIAQYGCKIIWTILIKTSTQSDKISKNNSRKSARETRL